MSELRQANDADSAPAVIFLPGIIMPAEFRYAPLIRELGSSIRAFTKELEIYDPATSGEDYALDVEIEALAAAIDARGIDRCYLYGHSAGGAISIAFAARQPDRLLGLGLDEPASDFTEETKAFWSKHLGRIGALPAEERLPAFMRAQVASDVEVPPPPPGEPPAWMAQRPAGVERFAAAMASYELNPTSTPFAGPMYYSFGSRTNPIWRDIGARLASVFPNFESEEYEGLHHLNTSHAAEPARVAFALRRVWSI